MGLSLHFCDDGMTGRVDGGSVINDLLGDFVGGIDGWTPSIGDPVGINVGDDEGENVGDGVLIIKGV